MMQPHFCSNIVQCCILQSFSYCNKRHGLRGPLMTWCHPFPKNILGAKGTCTCELRPDVLSVCDLGRRPKICKEHCHILFVAGKHNLQPYLRQKLVLLASAGRINLGRGGSGEHSSCGEQSTTHNDQMPLGVHSYISGCAEPCKNRYISGCAEHCKIHTLIF